MCRVALIGVEGDVWQLRSALSAHQDSEDFDLDSPRDRACFGCFPVVDAVVSVTIDGCSCRLLAGLGVTGVAGDAAHLSGVGYAFRRALASATRRFGSVRLLIHCPGTQPMVRQPRSMTLDHFLRIGLLPGDVFLRIRA